MRDLPGIPRILIAARIATLTALSTTSSFLLELAVKQLLDD